MNNSTNEVLTLTAESRTTLGKASTKALKKMGKIPAIINDNKGTSIHIAVDSHRLNIMHKQGLLISSVFDLEIDNKTKTRVFIREIQQHYLTDLLEHIDFQEIRDLNKVRISLYFVNADASPGIKRGGIVNIIHRYLWCMCENNSIIKSLDVDISQKKIGDFIRLDEIKFPEGVTPIIKNPKTPIINIIGKKGKGKDEEEGEEKKSEETKT